MTESHSAADEGGRNTTSLATGVASARPGNASSSDLECVLGRRDAELEVGRDSFPRGVHASGRGQEGGGCTREKEAQCDGMRAECIGRDDRLEKKTHWTDGGSASNSTSVKSGFILGGGAPCPGTTGGSGWERTG